MNTVTGSIRIGLATALACLAMQSAQAQRMSGEEVIDALQNGGYVLVMRQAPASLEAARNAGRGGGGFGFGGGGGGRGRGGEAAPEPTEPALEQQSREMLTGMRHAVWTFGIHIDEIYASPARPTREHAEDIPFVDIEIIDDLSADNAGSGWLSGKLAEMPMAGANTIIVTHSPNIENALDMSVAEGETLVVRPGDEPEVVGRLGLREWSVLAIELGDPIEL